MFKISTGDEICTDYYGRQSLDEFFYSPVHHQFHDVVNFILCNWCDQQRQKVFRYHIDKLEMDEKYNMVAWYDDELNDVYPTAQLMETFYSLSRNGCNLPSKNSSIALCQDCSAIPLRHTMLSI